VPEALSGAWFLVFAIGGIALTLLIVCQILLIRDRPSYLDEDWDWGRGACCLAAKCGMVPRNQWPACGTPAATAAQAAQGQADMESQQFAGSRIQRVSEHDIVRQLREDQFFARSGAYIHRQRCR
jgi:hypothetical protein